MNLRIFEKLSLPKEYFNTDNWPTVNLFSLSEEEKAIFIKRKEAVILYMKNEDTVRSITENTGVDKCTLQRLIKRCLEFDDEGLLWGFRALIPFKRLVKYKRKDMLNSINDSTESHKNGVFELLLDTYPDIKGKIESLYLNKDKNSVNEPNIKPKYIHKKFVEACRAEGIKVTEYPFNTKDLCRRSLYRYLKKIEMKYSSESIKRYGKDVERHFNNTGAGEKNRPLLVRPFERVEFDGHRIDAMFTITFTTPEGDEITEVLQRLWILVIIDVATRVILGYHISLNKEYSSEDVLLCIRNAVLPKTLRELTIPSVKYPENTGYASIAISEAKWALWDELCYDNGKANLSQIVREKLTMTVGCAVNPGPVSTPERRSIIERFFGLLEENGYHRLPSTTGSNPHDPRRDDPEQKAKKYNISIDHLDEITEILIANYNNTPHSGINYLTPLECMAQKISKGLIPRIVDDDKRMDLAFLTIQVQRIVQGNIKRGKKPYIYYEGVEYRSDILGRSLSLIGTKLDLYINMDDVRVIKAYLPDGSEFGYLIAAGKWGVTPHTLRIRKQINKLRNKNLLQITSFDDPIEAYNRFLEASSVKNKKDRNNLAALKKMQEDKKNVRTLPQHVNNGIAEERKNHQIANENKKEVEKQNDQLNSMRHKFKTFTF